MRKLIIHGHEFKEFRPGIWRLEPSGKRRVGVHLVGSQKLLERISDDRSVEQAMNVSTLPGVMDPVLTMPDIHQGYGFPIGGVAAFREKDGVVSPGGVGYDINCGVRLLKTPLERSEISQRDTIRNLVSDLFNAVPCGVGSKRHDVHLNERDLKSVLQDGAHWAVKQGYGTKQDLEYTEENGRFRSADPEEVSPRALERGLNQLGTLGSGNHFLEIQYVDEIVNEDIAETFGLFKDQIVITVHTGSRGLGYQVCSDFLERSWAACRKYHIEIVDRELAAAPLHSEEGHAYLGAMAAAANFAFANRQVITHWVREIFDQHFGPCELTLLYDVCHNIAKFEEVQTKTGSVRACVHRKGATRAYPPRHPQLPQAYRDVGQPVLVPGDMGRYSYVLAGKKEAMELTYGSACHGAGRELSRQKAKKLGRGRSIVTELEAQGIYLRCAGRNTVVEEMPEAYKDVAEVVEATAHAQFAQIVARLKPMGVVKG